MSLTCEQFKELRESRMPQSTLARRLRVHRQVIYAYETRRFNPRLDRFIQIADALEVSLDKLAGRDA